MRKNFIKVEEDFVCDNCGHEVLGSGYTNHCPKCLWSKHVDESVPGDRTSTCLGMMGPVGTEQKRGEWRILHKCTKCGKEKWNKVAKEDDLGAIAKLSQS